MSWTAREPLGTAVTAALATVLAVAIAGLGLQLIPSGLPVWDVSGREWLYPWSHRAAFLVAALALACAASTAALAGRRTTPPVLALAASVAAVAWASLAPAVWAGDPWVRGAALVVAGLLPAAMLHLALALRVGGGPAPALRSWRPAVAAAYAVVGAAALLHALARNPFTDLGCLVRCESVDAVLDASWVARGSAATVTVVGGLVALAAAATALSGARAVSGVDARMTPLLLAVSAALEVAWAWWPGARAVVGPLPWDAPLLLAARAVTLCLFAGCLTGVVLLQLQRRASLRRLAREITEVTPPASLSEVIASRLGDPSARLDFFVDADGVWVDEQGRPSWRGEQQPGRQIVLLRRGPDVVARLTTASRARARDLEEGLGPAALLALEAERARAEQLFRLSDLRDNRRRAVQQSDVARRRAERDLHDGAQHLLLAASFALQEAMQLARASDEQERAERLAAVSADVSHAAREVRQVAHGIYPVLLGDAGVVPALEGLARESDSPVVVDATTVPRMDSSVELTAYLVAGAAVHAAGAGQVRLAVSHDRDILRLVVAGDALGGLDVRQLVDRSEALGGTMEVMDGTWRLELPCA